MVRKILIAAFAGLTSVCAMAFSPGKTFHSDDLMDFYNGKVSVAPKAMTRAAEGEQSLDYTLASLPATAFRLKNMAVGDTVFLAFQMPLSVAKTFAGDQITSVNITTGVYQANGRNRNLVKDVTVFIAEDIEDLKGTTICEQEGTLGVDGFTEYQIPLDTPFDIKGDKTFYVGYHFKIPNLNQFYICVDGIPTDELYGGWIGTTDGAGTISWTNCAENYGNICLGCTVTGPNMPAAGVSIEDYGGPSYAAPGKPFIYEFLFKGTGPGVDNVEVSYQLGKDVTGSQTITFDGPLNFNKTTVGAVELEMSETGMGLPMTFRVTKVNGEEYTSSQEVTGYMNCFDSNLGYQRMHLIEEGTGTWCGYCPRGIVMMEYVAENYNDLFARAALHASGSTRDPMEVSSAMPVLSQYLSYFPSAMVDRTMYLENMTTQEVDAFVKANEGVPAVVAIEDLKGEATAANRVIVESNVKFPLGFNNNGRYRMAYYITQNNMGPYNQVNYYSGTDEPLGGWEREGDSVSTIYNDVVRYLGGGVDGFARSIPDEIKAGEEYPMKSSLLISAVTSDEFEVIAFVVDTLTGEIANANRIKVSKVSAIGEIESDSDVVSVKYYDLGGVEVKEPANGLYIVRTIHADGNVTVSKVMK